MPVRRPNRPQQLGELIREEMSDLLQREMSDPRVELVSITEVEVTQDLKYARIYFSRLGDDAERQETLKALQHATPYLRRLLAGRLTIRSVPEIEFRLDSSLEHGERVMRLLNQLPELRQPPAPARGEP
ncbi:MAG: 30S ribosome-binding factor RbfA [Chloroflexi bacterium]|nr:30S ribosome-binding factor RbfA [Chloroflexota bacterium]